MSYDSPAPTPSPHHTTFDTRLAYIQSQGSSIPSSSSSATYQPRQSSTSLRPPALASHPGCVLCSLVASSSEQPSSTSANNSPGVKTSLLPPTNTNESNYHEPFDRIRSPSPILATRRSNASGKEVVHQDSEVTVYKAQGKESLCSDGKHLIVVLNKHLENVYDLGPSDVPLLSHIIELSNRLLGSLPAQANSSSSDAERGKGKGKENDVRVGLVGSVMKDPQCPHAHLHAHAMLGPVDTSLPGASFWRRNVVFGTMNWWGIEDLRAEIREETSNNRVKSGYQHRDRAPIDRVPDAGSLAGLPNALDPSDYQDQSSPSPTKKPDSLIRSLSKRPATGSANSSTEVVSTQSKGKVSERQDAEPRPSEEGDEGYVAVDLNEISSNPTNRVERGGRI
ncbi:uncharacterized protein IL334_003238 [Kwoniella shivajii]|uniref:HIT domain-containing protein n=1 Tax=Kwoniella shivajii TaxID=564305 RepID=A0ABZ1CXB3_9TREE|nr:hypothetical protein IL334_003238 [Kwoniella shivajii]